MFSFFSWLRQQSKQAVLAGLADAVEELETVESPETDIEGMRKKLSDSLKPKALPAAEAEPETTKRKKS